jgi:hypothetical protein
MANVETAEMIGRTRTVTANALLEGRADLSVYPFQLLAVVSQRGVGAERVGYAVAAAEMLMQYGWDLVSVSEFAGSHLACAVMRRRPSV